MKNQTAGHWFCILSFLDSLGHYLMGLELRQYKNDMTETKYRLSIGEWKARQFQN